MGRPLGRAFGFAGRLRFAVDKQLGLPHKHESRLQRRFDGLLSRRLLWRPDAERAGGHVWLLYDIYRGEHGRLRQSIQYSYAERFGWSGVGGIQAKGVDNMFWTSFRYYIP
jgi:hypothetical protein